MKIKGERTGNEYPVHKEILCDWVLLEGVVVIVYRNPLRWEYWSAGPNGPDETSALLEKGGSPLVVQGDPRELLKLLIADIEYHAEIVRRKEGEDR